MKLRNRSLQLLIIIVFALAACNHGDEALSTYPPPSAILKVNEMEQLSAIGTTCWAGGCGDSAGVPTPQDPLVVTSPFTATFDLAITNGPIRLDLHAIPVSSANMLESLACCLLWDVWDGIRIQTRLARVNQVELELGPGLYVLRLYASWGKRGDAVHGFLLEVK